MMSKLLNRLRLARGAPLTHEELEHLLWGDDPNGGPLYARECLAHVARSLKRLGYPIATVWGYGYRYAWSEWEVGVARRPNLGSLTKALPTTVTDEESERLGRVAHGLGARLHCADPNFVRAERATEEAVKLMVKL